jgi:hypothetical protein
MLGLTRIDLPFLEDFRCNWEVIIGLDLLSLAYSGLGLGSCCVTSSCLCHPCRYYGYFDPISVENRIWSDGMELVGVMPMVQGFVRCDAGSLWLVIIPKSKDQFMERPHMKVVQPSAYMGTTWRSVW